METTNSTLPRRDLSNIHLLAAAIDRQDWYWVRSHWARIEANNDEMGVMMAMSFIGDNRYDAMLEAEQEYSDAWNAGIAAAIERAASEGSAR